MTGNFGSATHYDTSTRTIRRDTLGFPPNRHLCILVSEEPLNDFTIRNDLVLE